MANTLVARATPLRSSARVPDASSRGSMFDVGATIADGRDNPCPQPRVAPRNAPATDEGGSASEGDESGPPNKAGDTHANANITGTSAAPTTWTTPTDCVRTKGGPDADALGAVKSESEDTTLDVPLIADPGLAEEAKRFAGLASKAEPGTDDAEADAAAEQLVKETFEPEAEAIRMNPFTAAKKKAKAEGATFEVDLSDEELSDDGKGTAPEAPAVIPGVGSSSGEQLAATQPSPGTSGDDPVHEPAGADSSSRADDKRSCDERLRALEEAREARAAEQAGASEDRFSIHVKSETMAAQGPGACLPEPVNTGWA